MFNIFFWPITYYRFKKGIITNEMIFYKNHYKLILTGIFDALNGLLIVYSSSLQRTPGSLQAILMQSIIPFTIVFSKIILKKVYSLTHFYGAGITLVGLIISLIPTFYNFSATNGLFWPSIFLIGNIPAVLMNIIEEDIFLETKNKYDSVFLLAWESLYQLITVILLFWTDIIPGFGTSVGLSAWWDKLSSGLTCFLTPWSSSVSSSCDYCFLFGTMFTIAYCMSYIFGASMMKHASANSAAMVGAVCPCLVVFFWVIFKDLNAWAGGHNYSKFDIICYIVSLPFITCGIFVFRRAERIQKLKKLDEIQGCEDINLIE
jgi:drug/metabolite transporter (DMT)-like permease